MDNPQRSFFIRKTFRDYNDTSYLQDEGIVQTATSITRLVKISAVKNLSHTLAYSLVALQEMNLAYKYPTIFWDCANLIVDSGAVEGIDDKSANYNKIANAVNKIKTTTDINVTLVDINKSERSFTPDAENNLIYYGLAGLQGVGVDVITEIVNNRPYNSLQDFMNKTPVNKTVMVSLIKGGAFDCFGERKDIMKEYLWSVCESKKRITMQNFNALLDANLIPKSLNFQKRLFVYNKALKKNCKKGKFFLLEKTNYYKFYSTFFDVDLLKSCEQSIGIEQKQWKKLYDNAMLPAKKFVQENKDKLLEQLNDYIFQETWNKYAVGNYSAWEMYSLGMYYHEHELAYLNEDIYNIVHFNDLPQEPVIESRFRDIPLYKTYRIAGTVISKDDLHSSIMILTNNNQVIQVKMNKDYYARYNKRISVVQPDGTKKNMEAGFLQRGTLVVVNGFRRGNSFILKSYKNTKSHQLYKITKVNNDGTIEMTNKRYGEE